MSTQPSNQNSKLLERDILHIKEAIDEIKEAIKKLTNEQKEDYKTLEDDMKNMQREYDLKMSGFYNSIETLRISMSENRIKDAQETWKINEKLARFLGIGMGALGLLQVASMVYGIITK